MNPRVIIGALGGVAVLCLIIAVSFILTEPGRQKAEAEAARGGQVVAEGGQAAAHDASKASEIAAEAVRASEAITDQNYAEILSTLGADRSIGPVSDVGLVSLCRRAAYHDHPRCRSMRAVGS